MEEISQWGIAALIGISIAAFLVWFNKSGSDFKDGFEIKSKGRKRQNKFLPMQNKKQVVHISITKQCPQRQKASELLLNQSQ